MCLKKNNLIRASFLFILINFLLMALLCTFSEAKEIEGKVDEYIKAHMKLGNFSGSLLIAKDNKILVCRGYAMANIEHGVQNLPETKFRLGSVTKQFTAMLIMQMEERGQLSAEDTLAKYIPDYPEGEKITLHHLLTHTSGVKNITALPELEDIKTLYSPVEKTIKLFKNKPLDFPPGAQYKYSNSGYILLGYIIEKVSGKPYAEYIKENILIPLNMKNSGYDSFQPIIKNRAAGYALGDQGPVNADYLDMSIPHGGGGLYSTVEDMYIWDRALYTEKLVKKDTLDKIFTPFKGSYGYGWRISKRFNRKCTEHGGGIEGFTAYISRYPEEDLCIIVLSNLEYARISDISRDMAAIIFNEKYDIPADPSTIEVDPAIYKDYAGVYEFEPDNVLNVTLKNNRLYINPPGQPPIEIFPQTESKFFIKAFKAEITFVRDKKGKVTQLVFHVGGNNMPAKKIK